MTATLKAIHRFPRLRERPVRDLPAERESDELKAERAALEQQAFAMLLHPIEWRIALGRIFIRIKDTLLKHGQWESYFAQTFTARFDITVRTAQNYMNLAREATSEAKNENDSLSHSASDEGAVKTREATAKAERELGDRRIVNIPLLLAPNEQEAIRKLLKSSRWREARRKITKFVNRVCHKFNDAEEGHDEHDEPAAD